MYHLMVNIITSINRNIQKNIIDMIWNHTIYIPTLGSICPGLLGSTRIGFVMVDLAEIGIIRHRLEIKEICHISYNNAHLNHPSGRSLYVDYIHSRPNDVKINK